MRWYTNSHTACHILKWNLEEKSFALLSELRPLCSVTLNMGRWLKKAYSSSVQYTVALYAFVYPKLAKARRAALAPLHVFLGKSVFVLGLATMAVGLSDIFKKFLK